MSKQLWMLCPVVPMTRGNKLKQPLRPCMARYVFSLLQEAVGSIPQGLHPCQIGHCIFTNTVGDRTDKWTSQIPGLVSLQHLISSHTASCMWWSFRKQWLWPPLRSTPYLVPAFPQLLVIFHPLLSEHVLCYSNVGLVFCASVCLFLFLRG